MRASRWHFIGRLDRWSVSSVVAFFATSYRRLPDNNSTVASLMADEIIGAIFGVADSRWHRLRCGLELVGTRRFAILFVLRAGCFLRLTVFAVADDTV
jgi:hypothetical protein